MTKARSGITAKGVDSKRNEVANKEAVWQKRFAAWMASGLTRRAFCAREGLKLSTFDYWRRRLMKPGGKTVAARGLPVAAARAGVVRRQAWSKAQPPRPALTLLPLPLSPLAAPNTWELSHPQGWRLRLPADLTPAWLGELLRRLS